MRQNDDNNPQANMHVSLHVLHKRNKKFGPFREVVRNQTFLFDRLTFHTRIFSLFFLLTLPDALEDLPTCDTCEAKPGLFCERCEQIRALVNTDIENGINVMWSDKD